MIDLTALEIANWCDENQIPYFAAYQEHSRWSNSEDTKRMFVFFPDGRDDGIVFEFHTNANSYKPDRVAFSDVYVWKWKQAYEKGLEVAADKANLGAKHMHSPIAWLDYGGLPNEFWQYQRVDVRPITNKIYGDRQHEHSMDELKELTLNEVKRLRKREKSVKKQLIKLESKLGLPLEKIQEILTETGEEFNIKMERIADRIVRWHTFYHVFVAYNDKNGMKRWAKAFTIAEGGVKDNILHRIEVSYETEQELGLGGQYVYANSTEEICEFAKLMLTRAAAQQNAREYAQKHCVFRYNDLKPRSE